MSEATENEVAFREVWFNWPGSRWHCEAYEGKRLYEGRYVLGLCGQTRKFMPSRRKGRVHIDCTGPPSVGERCARCEAALGKLRERGH